MDEEYRKYKQNVWEFTIFRVKIAHFVGGLNFAKQNSVIFQNFPKVGYSCGHIKFCEIKKNSHAIEHLNLFYPVN